MSLNRRNLFAWILIALSGAAWVYSQSTLSSPIPGYVESTQTTVGSFYETDASVAASYVREADSPGEMDSPGEEDFYGEAELFPESSSFSESMAEASPFMTEPGNQLMGIFSRIASLIMAIIAIFVLYAKSPLLGPDGAALAPGFFYLLNQNVLFSSAAKTWISIVAVMLLLLCLRELWGWIRGHFSLDWCLCRRIAYAAPAPQWHLLIMSCWTAVFGALFFLLLPISLSSGRFLFAVGTAIASAFGVCCLWSYGLDLCHLKKQLDNFQRGLPVDIKKGAFAQMETQLTKIQSTHKEAIHTAVTSERFKVELISNVSHDLRTPLTAILGYGELLQKETLSPVGQKQLSSLNQKAGYMRDLVDSLFELTKVSSGAIECKKEGLDLIRLLEQTMGLFHDQLTVSGLSVRRHYGCDTAPVVTDGTRVHQVFSNLLENAIKYALSGTRIHLEVKEEDGHYLVRMVNTASYEMDFTPEEIMQRFTRGDKARSTKGSGLGLAIARTYTESVGGQFYVSIDGDQFNAIVALPKN